MKKQIVTFLLGAVITISIIGGVLYFNPTIISNFVKTEFVESNKEFNKDDFNNGQMDSSSNIELEEEPLEVAYAEDINTSYLLSEESSVTNIVLDNDNCDVEISSSGTYLISGTADNGHISVKKETKGVVLIFDDVELSSSNGSVLSIGKNSEVKIIVKGDVSFTNNENPEDENSTDLEVKENFNGNVIEVKDGANVYLTGDGNLYILGNSKNGIKSGNDSNTSFVIDGDLNINITAVNDAINAGYDLFIYKCNLNIESGDDAIHADRILTIGKDENNGPTINVTSCNEGFEGTIINLLGGTTYIKSTDDAVNAANSDKTYADSLTFAINILGGTHTIDSGVDGLDSNGDVNIVGGFTVINAKQAGGDSGIDYDNKCYINEEAVENNAGIAGPDNAMFGGMMNGDRKMGNGFPPSDFEGKERPESEANFDKENFNEMRRPDEMPQDNN